MKNTATRKHFKALEKGFRFFSLMRLHDANDDVFTSYSSDAGRLQHRERLPNARGRPEENLETSTYSVSLPSQRRGREVRPDWADGARSRSSLSTELRDLA